MKYYLSFATIMAASFLNFSYGYLLRLRQMQHTATLRFTRPGQATIRIQGWRQERGAWQVKPFTREYHLTVK